MVLAAFGVCVLEDESGGAAQRRMGWGSAGRSGVSTNDAMDSR